MNNSMHIISYNLPNVFINGTSYGRLINSWNHFILNTLINICLDILVKIIIAKTIFVSQVIVIWDIL